MQSRDWHLQDALIQLEILFFEDWRLEKNITFKDLKLHALEKVRQWRVAAQNEYFSNKQNTNL